MSPTTIIDCISSLLERERASDWEVHKDLFLSLRIFKTFILCSRKLQNDPSLKHLLARIEEKLQEKAVEYCGIHQPRLASLAARGFKQIIDSWKDEMDEWYVTVLECSCTPHSTSLMTNEILEIITSILECTVYFYGEIDPAKVKMTFLKSLIHFVTREGVKVGKDSLFLFETITMNTAYVLFRDAFVSSSEISAYLPRKRIFDPHVYNIYPQSIRGSKQLADDDALSGVKNYLDYLLSNLPEIIYLNTFHIVSMKEELQKLYERLISLKILLKQPIANFDMKIQGEIVDVVTDTSISISLLFEMPQKDVNFHQRLFDKLEIIMSKISETGPKKPIFNSPRTSSYGFVDSVMEKLMEMTSSEADHEFPAKSHVQTVQVELTSLRHTLGEFVELVDDHPEIQTLWDRLLEVAFKVESVIYHQVVDPLSDPFLAAFASIIEDIGNIKADVLKIKLKRVLRGTYRHLPSQTAISTSDEIFGFQVEERAVIDQLSGGSQHLRLIAIVGMAGLGKTTLAKKVYDHSSVSYHFSAKAWCTVSQALDKRNVLCHLLKQISPNMSLEMTEHDLADQLRRSLKGKRYLIILDDIWNTEAWNRLKDSFPDDTKGSRIIFTSRTLDIAPRNMVDHEPLILSPLGEKDSLSLICRKLFPGKGYVLPPALHGLGMRILARCGGLPLAIIIVSGVLANAEVEAWEEIISTFSFLSGEDNCRYTLEFSYRYLPVYLRPCFLYFGAFREDEEISVRRLLCMWIAESFVQKSEANSLEDVAEGYLNMLVSRSLVMASKQKDDGGINTCRIHDLLRDFCIQKAKDEHFFHFVAKSDELYSFNEPPNARRLLIDFVPEALYCPHACTLIVSIVLDWCSIEMQLRRFPNIRQLKCKLINDEAFVKKFVFPEFSSKLESLALSAGYPLRYSTIRFEFASLINLRKLKLSHLHLCWEIFSVIGNQLPSLEVLKLKRLTFEDELEFVWEMKTGEFSKLRILHLYGLPIRRWIACDDHEFECFQKLRLSWCSDLVELPSCLESIETLEAIEVSVCSAMIKELVRKIGVEQNDWGNSGLKITGCNT